MVTYAEGYGYSNEEPTDKQIQLQDSIDNAIHDLVRLITNQYEAATGYEETSYDDFEWDIAKITEIRETIQDLYGLEDVY